MQRLALNVAAHDPLALLPRRHHDRIEVAPAKRDVVFVEKSKTGQGRYDEEMPILFPNLTEYCPMRSLDT